MVVGRRLEAVTQESGAVTVEGLPDEGLGQDVGDVTGGGDGAEEDRQTEDPPHDHGIAGRHSAGVLVDLFCGDSLGDGLGVREEGGRVELVEADANVEEEGAEALDALVGAYSDAQLRRTRAIVPGTRHFQAMAPPETERTTKPP